MNTGSVLNGFYLAQIKPVDQTDAKPADFLLELKDFTFNEDDKKDTKLGEFDYNSWSGWMYSTGDSDNDAAMLDFAGVGVAMGNGEEALKQKADLIAPTNEDGGVADMLELAIKGEI